MWKFILKKFHIFNDVGEKIIQSICYLHFIRCNFHIVYIDNFFLDLILSERKGLYQKGKGLYQNFLLLVITFSFRFAKYSFSLSAEVTKISIACQKLNYFDQLRFFKTFFLRHVLCMIASDNALVMKCLLFPCLYFFFLGPWRLSTS